MMHTIKNLCAHVHSSRTHRIRFFIACSILSFSILVVGCKESRPETFTLNGTITLDQKPVPRGTINFFPEKGTVLGGPVQSDGRFSFQLPKGQYRVTIRAGYNLPKGWKEGDPIPKNAKFTIPNKYGNPKRSELSVEITGEAAETTKDFSL